MMTFPQWFNGSLTLWQCQKKKKSTPERVTQFQSKGVRAHCLSFIFIYSHENIEHEHAIISNTKLDRQAKVLSTNLQPMSPKSYFFFFFFFTASLGKHQLLYRYDPTE